MARFVTNTGRVVETGVELGTGGEGSVFEVRGETGLVAKIYHAPNPKRAAKLAAMVRSSGSSLMDVATWPVATLHPSPGAMASGFLMRRLSRDEDIHNLAVSSTRIQKFPKATYRFLVHVAMNVARAFAAVHAEGYVIGDVNNGGVRVALDGTVSLVDCDSFQVSAQNGTFYCDVGVPLYQPPEFQSLKTFRDQPRTANHDAFGLAVLLFQTLCFGRHPYAGVPLSGVDRPLEESIREYRFAYAQDAVARDVKQPPISLGLGSFSHEIASMFEHAFLEQGSRRRPTAEEWAHALERFAQALKPCARDSAHAYVAALNKCPLCEFEVRFKRPIFATPSAPKIPLPSIKLDELWAEIESLLKSAHVPQPKEIERSVTPHLVRPDWATRLSRRRLGARALSITLAVLAVVAAVVFNDFLVGVGVFALVPAAYFLVRGRVPSELAATRQSYADAKANWDRSSTALLSITMNIGLKAQLNECRTLYESLKNYAPRRLAVQQLFESHKREQQLQRHLDRARLIDRPPAGFGRVLLALLQSYGIETAGDVTSANLLGVPGIGERRRDQLLDWRNAIANTFRFNPNDPADQQALARELATLDATEGRDRLDFQGRVQTLRATAPSIVREIANYAAEAAAARTRMAELEYVLSNINS